MVKSLREAKVRSTWAAPDTAYEAATLSFVARALDVSRPNAFLESFRTFLARVALFGAANGLIQSVLKLTVPGVPDIYQGAELWDESLVDPDNRRPVDFVRRQEILRDLRSEPPSTLAAGLADGRTKLALIAALLGLRRERPALFAEGSYVPLEAAGADADRVCAFLREHDGTRLIVAVLLYPARGKVSADTRLSLPEGAAEITWRGVIGEETPRVRDGMIDAARLFANLPVAVLVSETV
jgi:(1->4)-alpha-D-glucan 1-alpha-D-glucosylmutase